MSNERWFILLAVRYLLRFKITWFLNLFSAKQLFFFLYRCRQIILPRHPASWRFIPSWQQRNLAGPDTDSPFTATLPCWPYVRHKTFQSSTPLDVFNSIVAGNTVSDVATVVMEERDRGWILRTEAHSASRQNYVDGAIDPSDSVLSSDSGETPTEMDPKVRPILYH